MASPVRIPVLSTTFLMAVVTVASAAAAGTDGVTSNSGKEKKSKVIIQTEHGPVTGTITSPDSGPDDPRRARPPIRIIVPDRPITPPHPHSEQTK